jgi:hypothetical protein
MSRLTNNRDLGQYQALKEKQMNSMIRMSIAVVAIAILFTGATIVRAEDKTDAKSKGGKVTGVLTHEGKPAADVTVRLFKASDMPQRGPGQGGQGRDRGGLSVQPGPGGGQGDPGQGRGPGQRQMPTPVAETKTNAEGKFSFDNVPAGDYMIMAGDFQTGMMGRQTAKVTEGGTVEITVELREMRRPDRGGQDGGQGGQRGRGGN